MHLALSDDDHAFRQRIRAFIGEHLPAEMREKSERNQPFDKDDHIQWQKILDRHGFGAPGWPVEYGGTGWTPLQRLIFAEELILCGCPRQSPYGLNMVGPVIYSVGSEWQKAHFLPRIRSADDWWCQGYSEPGAGSDLAALRTRARRDGDHYVVNGHKIWTSTAHEANMMFALVRTDDSGKRQRGISFLLIEMDSPGLTVRPIHAIDGNHRMNEVFFDEVRVPQRNLVGEEGQGWTYSNSLLQHERLGIADIPRSKKRLARLHALAGRTRADGSRLLDEGGFRRRLAQLQVDLSILEYTTMRFLAEAHAGRTLGPEVSMLKIRGSEIGQAIMELTVQAAGPSVLAYAPSDAGEDAFPDGFDAYQGIVEGHLFHRAATIYGGTNEILKSVIAKRVLGL